MIKKIFPFLSVIMLALFVGACSSEDVMPDIDQGAASRTITFTASMPGEDDPATRVSAAEEADRGITLTWDENDKLDLLFVQGENKFHESTTVTNIENGGKNATFTIDLPAEIETTEAYTLYGVYGGSGDITEGKIGVAAQTAEGNVGKNIMLRFEKEVAANSNNIGNLQFEHLGFLFTTKIKVTAGEINDIKLVSADGSSWIYNASDYEFNIETGAFTTTATATNAASFGHKVIDGNIITVRSWFPKANEEAWPALKLKINGTTETTTQKSAGNNPAVGKAYYIYANYDGVKLEFTNKDFPEKGSKENPYTVAETIAKNNSGEKAWVQGFIVGNANNNGFNPVWSVDGPNEFDIMIADNPDVKDANMIVCVQLPSGTVRQSLGLQTNPSLYKREVKVYGDLKAYMAPIGMRNTSDFEILPDGPFISVLPISLIIDNSIVTGETITVTSNVTWEATTDATWLTLNSASGTNNGVFTVDAEVNATGEIREATITITDTNDATNNATVTVKQIANDGTKETPYSVAEAIIKQDNGPNVWVKGFIVGHRIGSANVSFSDTGHANNIIIADSKDENDASNVLGVGLNVIQADLNLIDNKHVYKAEVKIRGALAAYYSNPGLDNAKEYEIIAYHKPFFISDVTEVEFQASGAALSSIVAITTIDTQAWTAASSDASWLTVAPTSGTGSGDVTVTAIENTEATARTATITLTPTGDASLTPVVVNVTQAAAGEVARDGLTKATAYIAADIAKNQGQNGVWVRAFIVGSDNGGLKIGITGNAASDTNIVISDNIDASTEAEIVRVALPKGAGRTDLNLKENPDKLKAEVLLKGDLEAYFSKPGLKEVKEYEVISLYE